MPASLPPPATPVLGGATIQVLSDSFGAHAGGNVYCPPGPSLSVTGDTTSGSATIANLSSTAGLQPGAAIAGAGIPSSALISSIGANSITISSNATATATGVSLTVASNALVTGYNYMAGTMGNSILGWLLAMSDGGLSWDPTTGYGGNLNGLYKVAVLNGGTGWPNSGTFTLSGVTYAFAPAASWAAQNGVIQSVTVTNNGGGLNLQPTLTDPGGQGSNASFSCVLGGNGAFAAGGDVTAGMLARLPDALAAKPDWLVIVSPATNDIAANSYTASQILANLTSIVDQATRSGIRVVLSKVPPRSVWSGTGTTARNNAVRNAVNLGIDAIGRRARSARPNAPSVLIADPNKYWVDAASTSGASLSSVTRDGLHPSMLGAFLTALAIREVMAPFVSSNRHAAYGQDDTYDATNNPGGNLLGTKGLFVGTTGTNSTALTGTVATGWTWQRATGTGALAGTIAAQARTDTLSGNEQYVNITGITGGGTTELYQLRIGTSTGNIAAGDWIYMTTVVRLSNYSRVNRLGITLSETLSGTAQFAYHLDGVQDAGVMLPDFTTLRNFPLTGLMRGFVQGATDGGFELHLRTPPIQARPGTSGYAVNVQIGFDASAGTPQATLQIRNCAVRKVV